MNHPSRRTLSLSAFAIVLSLAVAVAAAARSGPRGGDPLGRLERAVASLELDAETRASVYAVIDEARVDRRSRQGRNREAHLELRRLLGVAAPVEAEVLAQAEIVHSLRGQAHRAQLRTLLAVRSLLPADQEEALREGMQRGPRECRESR